MYAKFNLDSEVSKKNLVLLFLGQLKMHLSVNFLLANEEPISHKNGFNLLLSLWLSDTHIRQDGGCVNSQMVGKRLSTSLYPLLNHTVWWSAQKVE